MLHPLLLTALATLISNDHFFKEAHPGWLTGKLSDFAGLVVFPLMLLSIIDLTIGIRSRHGRKTAVTILIASGVVFAAIQMVPLAANGYRQMMGLLQYPFRAIGGTTRLATVRHIADPSDLVALPALWAAWMVAKRAVGSASDGPRPNSIGT